MQHILGKSNYWIVMKIPLNVHNIHGSNSNAPRVRSELTSLESTQPSSPSQQALLLAPKNSQLPFHLFVCVHHVPFPTICKGWWETSLSWNMPQAPRLDGWIQNSYSYYGFCEEALGSSGLKNSAGKKEDRKKRRKNWKWCCCEPLHSD